MVHSHQDENNFYAKPNLKEAEDYKRIIEMLKNLNITAFYVCIPANEPRPYIQIVSPDLAGLHQALNTAYSTIQAMKKMQKLTMSSTEKAEKPSIEPASEARSASSSPRFYQPAATGSSTAAAPTEPTAHHTKQ